VDREAGQLVQGAGDDRSSARGTQPDPEDLLLRRLLDDHGPRLRAADPRAPADRRVSALEHPVALAEVQQQLDAAIREHALATMNAGAFVGPHVVDESVQLRRPPRAVAPSAERREAACGVDPHWPGDAGAVHDAGTGYLNSAGRTSWSGRPR